MEKYPNSIGSTYINETYYKEYIAKGTPYVDYDIFYNIVNNKLSNIERLVNLHIRIGDAFSVKNISKLSIDELGKVGSDYVQPLHFL